MNEVEIKFTELETILRDPNTTKEEFDKYFVYDEEAPITKPSYKLRDDVIILDEDGQSLGLIGDLIMKLANSYARSKRNKVYRENLQRYPERITVLSEGDSWFQHPLVHDTIDKLMEKYNVISLGGAGHELKQIWKEKEYNYYLRSKKHNPKYFIFSGGGNDILGDEFQYFLNPYSDGTPGENSTRFFTDSFWNKIEKMKSWYTDVCNEAIKYNPAVKMIVYGYDYVIPNNKNAKKPNKSWLGVHMDDKGISNVLDQKGIIKILIDTINVFLISLEERYDHVHYIDTRDKVNGNWYDEIHPDENGFKFVADVFKSKIDALEAGVA